MRAITVELRMATVQQISFGCSPVRRAAPAAGAPATMDLGCVVGRTGPRASDRKCKAGRLNVDEEPLAVLAESRSTEFRVVDFVAGQRVGPALAGHAHQVRDAVAVLGQDQA